MLVGLFVGKRNSRPWIVSDELWLLIKPLLPQPAPKLVAGRPRVPDRQALCGILFVLHTGIQWEYLPQELGFGSGMTCWRRLAAWNEAGVWDRLHAVLLTKLRSAKQLDWSRAVIDSSHVRAARRGPKSGPSPVDRARPGSKHHVLVDGQGIPLAVSLTGGNRNDITQLMPLLAKVPPVAGLVGRPRRRPDTLLGDRGYDHDKYRRLVWAQGIKPVIARRGVPHGSGLGVHRWVVERTIAWLHAFRRLRVRWERRDDIHEAFLGLATCLITHRHVQRLC
ncbi:IS5 family transposase [Streptomyces sp. NBC_00053]|uniref:IS5 family transposase n=1 Tax=Streptomyces sp. ADI95-17 TaxID=1522759 RepID=UPI000F5BF30A|nr:MULTISPECIES: IS5 family transposase [unclassified Streptomyces]WSG55359.1 IS5 family transposase [Streptomyces sp. NBC_01732]WSX06495.1 IS5 family transposase [Streptomyces sp. NBC_00987]MCX5165191.1 IS5 family transposase [Streptomyces sp. NBC_00305]MCX5223714.1 IS5 family transposase [Streptomyces sp. NBC_00264]MCX5505296.1 IS5 family transposase [Streptomyces sp. NBC_00052]